MRDQVDAYRTANEKLRLAFDDFCIEPTEANAQEVVKAMWEYGPAFGAARNAGLIIIQVDEIVETDPNHNKYTCTPYGVPKCDYCLHPEEECYCQ